MRQPERLGTTWGAGQALTCSLLTAQTSPDLGGARGPHPLGTGSYLLGRVQGAAGHLATQGAGGTDRGAAVPAGLPGQPAARHCGPAGPAGQSRAPSSSRGPAGAAARRGDGAAQPSCPREAFTPHSGLQPHAERDPRVPCLVHMPCTTSCPCVHRGSGQTARRRNEKNRTRDAMFKMGTL